MSISESDIKKIAKLARIKLADHEVIRFKEDLLNILQWEEILQKVNTDNIQEISSVLQKSLPLREDVVTEPDISEKLMEHSSDSKYGCYVVPKVIEQ